MSALQIVRLPVDPIALTVFAVAEGLDDDDRGYALHIALRARFGSAGPQPFRLLETGGTPTLLGYVADSRELIDAAGLPPLDPRLHRIFPTKPECLPMPEKWRTGQRVGFELRARPVVRYGPKARAARAASGKHSAGERDAFLAALENGDDGTRLDRETVYRGWLAGNIREGAHVLETRIGLMRRAKVRRSRHAGGRTALVEGYEVIFSGTLEVAEPAGFASLLARGVGRHTAFGFGMLLLKPAGR